MAAAARAGALLPRPAALHTAAPAAALPPRAPPTLPPPPSANPAVALAAKASTSAAAAAVAAPVAAPSVANVNAPTPAASIAPFDVAGAATPRDQQARAEDLIARQLPRTTQRAERLVLRVLVAAADAQDDDELRSAARAIRLAPGDPQLGSGNDPAQARSLNDAARASLRRGDLAEAVALQTRAFGANPLDAEVAGNLAFMRLKQQPDRAEAARQLALHALTTHDSRYPYGRIEDWTTLAIANALTGRERDARNAWLVALDLAPQADRQCRAAVNAYATYGERVRPGVEALLYRASRQRGERAAICEWPPHWSGGSGARG